MDQSTEAMGDDTGGSIQKKEPSIPGSVLSALPIPVTNKLAAFYEQITQKATPKDIKTTLEIPDTGSMANADFSLEKGEAKKRRRALLNAATPTPAPNESESAEESTPLLPSTPVSPKKPEKPSAVAGQKERTGFMQNQGLYFSTHTDQATKKVTSDLLIYAPHTQSGLVKDQPFNNMYIAMHYDVAKWHATVGAAQGAELKLKSKKHPDGKTEQEILAIYQAEAAYHVALSIYADHLAAKMNGEKPPASPSIAVLSNYLSEGLTGVSAETNNKMVAIRRKAIEGFVKDGIPQQLLQAALAKIDPKEGEKIGERITKPLPLVFNQKALNLARNSATGSSDVALYERIKEACGIKSENIYSWPWSTPSVIANVPNPKHAASLLRELQGPAPLYALRWVADKIASAARSLTDAGLSLPGTALTNVKKFYTDKSNSPLKKLVASFPIAIGFVGIGTVASLAAIAYGAAIAVRLALMAPNSLTGMIAIGHQRLNQMLFYPAQVEKKTAGYFFKRALVYLASLVLLPVLPLTFLRSRGNQSLHREALKIALCEALGIPNPGGCKSGKDREGMVRLLAQSYQEYMAQNDGKVPPSMGSTSYYLQKMAYGIMNAATSFMNIFRKADDKVALTESPADKIDKIFVKNYLGGSAQFVAHANAAYTSGIKNIDFILGGRQIYVIRKEINRQVREIDVQIDDPDNDEERKKSLQAQKQRLINCLPENSNALAEGNKDYSKPKKSAESSFRASISDSSTLSTDQLTLDSERDSNMSQRPTIVTTVPLNPASLTNGAAEDRNPDPTEAQRPGTLSQDL